VYVDEPTTLLSNLLLSVVTIVLGVRLMRRPFLWARVWAVSFLFVSGGALLAGVCHGFASTISRDLWWGLWGAMLYLVTAGMALAAAAVALDPLVARAWRRVLLVTAAVGGVGTAVMVARDPNYAHVMRTAAVLSVLMVAALGAPFIRYKSAHTTWLITGVAIAVVGGAVRAAEVSLDPFLNANDLYHVIQVGAFDFIYRGAATEADPGPASPASA
jgi:hypothetical protein